MEKGKRVGKYLYPIHARVVVGGAGREIIESLNLVVASEELERENKILNYGEE